MGLLEDIVSAAVRGEELPDVPEWVNWKHISKGKTHCKTCLKLDNCWFSDDNKLLLPQHPFCHCTLIPLSIDRVLNEAYSSSDYSKFDPYLFDPENEYKHGKDKLFRICGYDVEDSNWLKAEFEKQAREKYIAGEYILGKLNENGQRISIRVEIPRKDKEGTVSFLTGWMAEPFGKIKLTTPYGGK